MTQMISPDTLVGFSLMVAITVDSWFRGDPKYAPRARRTLRVWVLIAVVYFILGIIEKVIK